MQRPILPENMFTTEQQRFLNDLFDSLFGSPIALTSDPTTTGGELAVNEVGFNPTTSKFFLNLNGTTYSISMTAV